MGDMATIHLQLPYYGRQTWNDFTSEKLRFAGFEWFVTGQYRDHYLEFQIQSTTVHCTPVDINKNSIWSCEATGEIVGCSSVPGVKRSKFWSHSFNLQSFESDPVQVEFHKMYTRGDHWVCKEREKKIFQVEVQLTVASLTVIDLSSENNQMIQSLEDAGRITVGGETLWLSKAGLSFHSPVFKKWFTSDVQNLDNFAKRGEFLHFIALLYGLPVRIDAHSIGYLLEIAVSFQCPVIKSRCREFLYYSEEKHVSFERKLLLANRYGFSDLITQVVIRMTSHQLKACVDSNAGGELSQYTYKCLTKRLNG